MSKLYQRARGRAGLALLLCGALACTGDLVSSGDQSADVPTGVYASLAAGTVNGDRVRVSDSFGANIRAQSSGRGAFLGSQPLNARGTVVGGPVVDNSGDRLTRWNIDFDTGPDGWAADPYITRLANVATVQLSPAATPLAPGARVQLAAVLKDSAGATLSGEPITWQSGNTAIATVSPTGLVSGVAAGTVSITATSGRAVGAALVTAPAGSRFVYGSRVRAWNEPANIRSLASGSSTLVGSQPVGSAGTVIGGPVADATGDGLTRWKVDFDAGADGWAADAYLAALPVVASVAVTPDSATLIEGTVTTLSAVAKDSSGTTVSGMPMSWLSRDSLVARVALTGAVTGVAIGTTWIIATSNGKNDSAQVSVIPVPVASVVVTPATGSLQMPATLQLSAVTKDSAGQDLAGRPIAWSSATPGVAGVTAAGVVSGVGAGVAAIIATSAGRSDTAMIAVTAAAPVHTGYYAAPNGSSTNDGSAARPWDLRTALAGGNGRVLPGDTIWMRGGTYTGTYRSTVAGAPGRPVVVRQYPGERAIIDANTGASSPSVFYVGGEYTVFWGFEITNSYPVRTTSTTSSNFRPNVVVNYASHTKYINLTVHDGGVAFYSEPQYSDVEVAGCIIYNNGWQGPTRGHGHGLYLKSNTGPVIARDNVIFNQFGYGVHGYSNAGSGRLINMTFEGNVAFNNGTQATGNSSSNILLGGDDYADADVLRDNQTWYSAGVSGTNVKIGYGTLRNGGVQLLGNYFAGGSTVLEVNFWTSIAMSGNTLYGTSQQLRLNDPALTLQQLLSGNVSLSTAPSQPRVSVRANPWEAGRAMVTVYNWNGQNDVSVDLSGVLSPGDRFQVHSVQSMSGAPAVSGTYNGPVLVPLRAIASPVPVGMTASRAPVTGPAFDVFIVTRN